MCDPHEVVLSEEWHGPGLALFEVDAGAVESLVDYFEMVGKCHGQFFV